MRNNGRTPVTSLCGAWPMLVGWLCLVPALALAQGDAPEQETNSPFSDWACQRCPEAPGWWGEGNFGLGWISDDSLRYGGYRGLEEKGFYPALDGEVHFRDATGLYLDGFGRDLGLDSRELGVKGGRQGRYELRLGWNEIPFYRGFGALTPFAGQGGEVLSLPAGWVPAKDTSGMTQLGSSLVAAPLGMQRETLDLGLTWKVYSAWSFEVDVQRQEKSGTRPFGGAGIFINNATLLPAPVDFTTDRVDLGVNWSNRQVQLRLGFMGSWFDNGQTSVTWDNPFTAGPGTERMRAALEPGNDYYQFNLAGAWAIRPNIHLSGHAAVGEASQDEAFLPYSINPDFGDVPLPRARLDGKVDTSVLNLGGKLYTRVNSRFSITAKARYDERDNRTPVDVYTPVTSDFIIIGERTNRPYGFERLDYSIDARYRLGRSVRLSGGGRRQEIDRTLQAVEESEETTWWGEVQFKPWTWAQLRLRGETARRDISEYLPPNDGGRADHPLLRKFNQADRDRDQVVADVYLTAASGLGLNLNYHDASDEYAESMLGLLDSEVQGYTLGVDYAGGGPSTLYAFWTRDEIDSGFAGADGSRRWTGDTRDRITTAGAGLSVQVSEESSVGLDVVWADTKGEIQVQTSAGEDPFRPLRTTLINLRLHFDQDVNEHWGYRLMAEYEDYDSQDWAVDGIGVDGLDPVLTFGLVSPKYSIWNLWVQARYRF